MDGGNGKVDQGTPSKVYRTRIAPYPHQSEALQKMFGRRNFALLMAMRTGKTKVILDEYGALEAEGHVNDLLVIAPGGVYRTWEQAARDHLSEELLSRLSIYVWRSSNAAGRQEFLSKPSPRMLLMNVEALSIAGSPARDFALRFASGGPMVVVDESTIIKNKSKRTEFILTRLRPLAKYRRILSGLATPRSPLDLFYQFSFLDWGILGWQSWYSYRATIAHMTKMLWGGRMVETIDLRRGDRGFRPEMIETVRRKIEPHSYRVEFRPKIPSTYTLREVQMTKEQKAAYDDMRLRATHALSETEHVTATVVIAQLIRMHQILLGHTSDEQGRRHEFLEHRTAELLELLEEYHGKAVIWCSYDYNVQKVTEALRKEYGPQSVARFWGGNANGREEEEREFQSNPECRFMVATPAAGGRGRTWHVADLVVYFSNTDNLEHRDQSEQRVMGINKERQVDFIDLICPGTVEEKIIHALRSKINMAGAINGDNYKEWLI